MNDLPGIQVFQRGWLSSNNILLFDDKEATLIDSGHVSHASQTVALVRERLGARRLARVINTHLHSDHCGGNAALQSAFRCELWIPPGQWDAVLCWDEAALSYKPTGQRCERFVPQRRLRRDETLEIGRHRWRVLNAPGHDSHSVILFDPETGVLISADALWESGFGVVFPEIEGVNAFAEVAAVLDLIESLPIKRVIPGHGAPFDDVHGALLRARARLKGFESDPQAHAWYAAKVLVKFHLLERQSVEHEDLLSWAASVSYLNAIQQRYFQDERMVAWCDRIVESLCKSGAARRTNGRVLNA